MNFPQYQPINYQQYYGRMGDIASGAVRQIGSSVVDILDIKDLKDSKSKVWPTIETDMKENGANKNEIDAAKKTFDSINSKDQLHNYTGAYAMNSQAYKAAVNQYGEEYRNKLPRPTFGVSDKSYEPYLENFIKFADKVSTQKNVQEFASDVQGGAGAAAMKRAMPPPPSPTPEEQYPGMGAAGRTLGESPSGQLPWMSREAQTIGGIPSQPSMLAGRDVAGLQQPASAPASLQEIAQEPQQPPSYSADQIAAAAAERGIGDQKAVQGMVSSTKAAEDQKRKQDTLEFQKKKWADLEARRNKDLEYIDAKITDVQARPGRMNRESLNKEAYLIMQFKTKSDANLKSAENYASTLQKALTQLHGKGIDAVILAELQERNGQTNFDEEWLTNELHNARTDLTEQKVDSKRIDDAYKFFQDEIAKQRTATGRALKRANEAQQQPAAPAQAQAAPAASPSPNADNLPVIKSKEEYAALKGPTSYINGNTGKRGYKP